jgi:putative DNA primase/helicase
MSPLVPSDAAGEVRRAAERLAVIAAAGELATAWALTGWQEGEAIDTAQRCFTDWLRARGTKGSSDLQAAIRQVCAFLERHGANRFALFSSARGDSDGEPPDAQNTPNRAGFRRRNRVSGETEYLVFLEIFRGEICAGYDHRAVLQELDPARFSGARIGEHDN